MPRARAQVRDRSLEPVTPKRRRTTATPSSPALPPSLPAVAPRTPPALRLGCLNTYLIPDFYVKYLVWQGDQFAVGSCRDQLERSQRILEFCRQHDVVALQEIWGGASDALQRGVDEEGFESHPRGWKGLPCGRTAILNDVVNTALTNARRTGGLMELVRRDAGIFVEWRFRHAFMSNETEESMNKSVSLTLLNMSVFGWGAGSKLLLLNCHLHSPFPFDNTRARREQREEVLALLRKVSAPASRGGLNVDWSKVGVLFCGDFNTAYALNKQNAKKGVLCPEYLETLRVFRARDLFLENDSPEEDDAIFTFDGQVNAYVSEAAKKDSARMDYVFALDELPNGVRPMRLRALRCNVLVYPRGQEPSDHTPLSLDIVPA